MQCETDVATERSCWTVDKLVLLVIQWTIAKLSLFQDASFAGELEDSKFDIRWCLVQTWQSNIRAKVVDVQEVTSNFSRQ